MNGFRNSVWVVLLLGSHMILCDRIWLGSCEFSGTSLHSLRFSIINFEMQVTMPTLQSKQELQN
jgi:hypothetical protein